MMAMLLKCTLNRGLTGLVSDFIKGDIRDLLGGQFQIRSLSGIFVQMSTLSE